MMPLQKHFIGPRSDVPVYHGDDVDQRLALMQRAIDWCVANGYVQQLIVASDIRVPAEFAEFIKARHL